MQIKYGELLKKAIHTMIVATVDEEGLPTTRAIDIMLVDEEGLYFITALGKAFYQQLMQKPYVAMTGMTGGAGTLEKKALSIRGKVRNRGIERLGEVFEKNPYMAEIYPTEASREALVVFQLYEGSGEFFDL